MNDGKAEKIPDNCLALINPCEVKRKLWIKTCGNNSIKNRSLIAWTKMSFINLMSVLNREISV